MRQSQLIRRVPCILYLLLCSFSGHGRGVVAQELPTLQLVGSDISQVESAFPLNDDASLAEMSKLIYRINRANHDKLTEIAQPLNAKGMPKLGDAFIFEGQVEAVKRYRVPQTLVEYLELESLATVTLSTDDTQSVQVITSRLPEEVSHGDRIRGMGIIVSVEDDGIAFAAPPLTWLPKDVSRNGWKLLVERGVDMRRLTEVSERNRLPLSAKDTDIFYAVLAAADEIRSQKVVNQIPPASPVKPVDLLKQPTKFTGDWVTMQVQTIQITRVSVEEPKRREQLGSDHYFQIDAMGDLGNTVIRIDPPDGSHGEPARFDGRYPVSLVSKTLPPFLANRLTASSGSTTTQSVVTDVSQMVSVDAFFFRLWSYSTDFMRQHGGGDQFGPLLIVANFEDREPSTADPAGVQRLGWIAAGATGLGVLAIFAWSRVLSIRDSEVKRKRRAREAEHLELPDLGDSL